MSPSDIKNDLLADIQSAVISEKSACSFYERALSRVKLIEGMHLFQEILEKEREHVIRLVEEWKRLGGEGEVDYDPEVHGGIALPPANDVDNLVALDVAIKEEMDSIKLYERLKDRHKDTETGRLFHALLTEEKEYLRRWKQIYNAIENSTGIKKIMDDVIYKFTNHDIEIIISSLENERMSFQFFSDALKKATVIDAVLAFKHMAYDEERHLKILEMMYQRLAGKQPLARETKQRMDLATFDKYDYNDVFKILDFAVGEDKRIMSMYFNFVDECTNSWLREILWELIEDEWSHIVMWRKISKRLKEGRL